MGWRSGRILAAALVAAALAGQAAAAVVVTTYRGTISNGTDTTGVFGAPGLLNGLSFVAIFRTDSDAPGATATFVPPLTKIDGAGPTPPVTATITIKGVTYAFGSGYGAQFQQDNGVSEFFEHYASNDGAAVLYAGGSGVGLDFLPSADWRTFTGADLSLVSNFFGVMDIHVYDPVTDTYTSQAKANLHITSVSVPEPATWALLIVGFGALGAVLRRRRHAGARLA